MHTAEAPHPAQDRAGSTHFFMGMSDALGFAWLALHLHILFLLLLNNSSIKEEHLQILSICIEEAKQEASVSSSEC